MDPSSLRLNQLRSSASNTTFTCSTFPLALDGFVSGRDRDTTQTSIAPRPQPPLSPVSSVCSFDDILHRRSGGLENLSSLSKPPDGGASAPVASQDSASCHNRVLSWLQLDDRQAASTIITAAAGCNPQRSSAVQAKSREAWQAHHLLPPQRPTDALQDITNHDPGLGHPRQHQHHHLSRQLIVPFQHTCNGADDRGQIQTEHHQVVAAGPLGVMATPGSGSYALMTTPGGRSDDVAELDAIVGQLQAALGQERKRATKLEAALEAAEHAKDANNSQQQQQQLREQQQQQARQLKQHQQQSAEVEKELGREVQQLRAMLDRANNSLVEQRGKVAQSAAAVKAAVAAERAKGSAALDHQRKRALETARSQRAAIEKLRGRAAEREQQAQDSRQRVEALESALGDKGRQLQQSEEQLQQLRQQLEQLRGSVQQQEQAIAEQLTQQADESRRQLRLAHAAVATLAHGLQRCVHRVAGGSGISPGGGGGGVVGGGLRAAAATGEVLGGDVERLRREVEEHTAAVEARAEALEGEADSLRLNNLSLAGQVTGLALDRDHSSSSLGRAKADAARQAKALAEMRRSVESLAREAEHARRQANHMEERAQQSERQSERQAELAARAEAQLRTERDSSAQLQSRLQEAEAQARQAEAQVRQAEEQAREVEAQAREAVAGADALRASLWESGQQVEELSCALEAARGERAALEEAAQQQAQQQVLHQAALADDLRQELEERLRQATSEARQLRCRCRLLQEGHVAARRAATDAVLAVVHAALQRLLLSLGPSDGPAATISYGVAAPAVFGERTATFGSAGGLDAGMCDSRDKSSGGDGLEGGAAPTAEAAAAAAAAALLGGGEGSSPHSPGALHHDIGAVSIDHPGKLVDLLVAAATMQSSEGTAKATDTSAKTALPPAVDTHPVDADMACDGRGGQAWEVDGYAAAARRLGTGKPGRGETNVLPNAESRSGNGCGTGGTVGAGCLAQQRHAWQVVEALSALAASAALWRGRASMLGGIVDSAAHTAASLVNRTAAACSVHGGPCAGADSHAGAEGCSIDEGAGAEVPSRVSGALGERQDLQQQQQEEEEGSRQHHHQQDRGMLTNGGGSSRGSGETAAAIRAAELGGAQQLPELMDRLQEATEQLLARVEAATADQDCLGAELELAHGAVAAASDARLEAEREVAALRARLEEAEREAAETAEGHADEVRQAACHMRERVQQAEQRAAEAENTACEQEQRAQEVVAGMRAQLAQLAGLAEGAHHEAAAAMKKSSLRWQQRLEQEIGKRAAAEAALGRAREEAAQATAQAQARVQAVQEERGRLQQLAHEQRSAVRELQQHQSALMARAASREHETKRGGGGHVLRHSRLLLVLRAKRRQAVHQLAEARAQGEQASRRADVLSQQLASRDKSIAHLRRSRQELRESLDASAARSSRLEALLPRLQARCDSLEVDKRRLQASLDRAAAHAAELTRKAEGMAKFVEAERAARGRAEALLQQCPSPHKSARLVGALGQLREQYADLCRRCSQQEAQLGCSKQELEVVEAASRQRIECMQYTLDTVIRELDATRGQLQGLPAVAGLESDSDGGEYNA